MPRVKWSIGRDTIDDFDRSKQFKPYMGPTPPVGSVFQFKLKVFRYFEATRDKYEQLFIGLELVPRRGRKDEAQYAGYFIPVYRSLADTNQFTYVPFFDAIGVRGRDLARTLSDEEGNIRRIGAWRNTGDVMLLAQIGTRTDQQGNTRPDISWFGSIDEDVSEPADDEEEDDYEEEEEEQPRSRSRSRTAERTSKRRTAQTRRARSRPADEEEDDPF